MGLTIKLQYSQAEEKGNVCMWARPRPNRDKLNIFFKYLMFKFFGLSEFFRFLDSVRINFHWFNSGMHGSLELKVYIL